MLKILFTRVCEDPLNFGLISLFWSTKLQRLFNLLVCPHRHRGIIESKGAQLGSTTSSIPVQTYPTMAEAYR